MNKHTWRVLLFPLLLLAMAGLACGISNPLEESGAVSTAAALAPTLEAAATELAPAMEAVATEASEAIATAVTVATEIAPTVEAAATILPELPVSTPVGGIEEFLNMVSGSDGLGGLTSFRQTAVLDFTGGGQTGKVDYWGEFTTDPQATHGRVTLSGLAAAGLPLPTFEYIIIEGATWIKIGRQPWMPVQEGVETFTGQQPYSADDFLFAIPQAQRVLPDQTVNGIECKHYVYTVSDFQFEGGSLNSANGEIYTAVNGGYIVQYTLHGEGSLDEYFAEMTGIINLVYNVLDVNSGFTIQPPR